MGKTLYRKYRPKNLSQVIGQDHITRTLGNALSSSGVSHAYLFTGPHGVGKTSVARILAHEVNELAYDEGANHLDIIEIDAASNRRIDEIRTLRERVHNAPASAKYKVYIIDEVHMLTKEAFNALLKTLEEPPGHVIFILATTEAHKLPETIISRCIRFTFKPVEPDQIVSHLKHIAETENIDISMDALGLLSEYGKGSFRDSISLLDQLSSYKKKITVKDTMTALGIAPDDIVDDLLATLRTGNAKKLVESMDTLQKGGYRAPIIAAQIREKIRKDLVSQAQRPNSGVYYELLRRLLDVPVSHDPMSYLEIVLLETAVSIGPGLEVSEKTAQVAARSQEESRQHIVEDRSNKATEKPFDLEEKETEEATIEKSELLNDEQWQKVLHELKSSHSTLHGVARMATPIFEQDKLTLTFEFPFHQKRINEAKNKQVLADIIRQSTGMSVQVHCVVQPKQASPKGADKRKQTSETKPKQSNNQSLNTIASVFGDAEVLE